MVNAMAPRAPSGASFMIMLMMLNITCAKRSMKSRIGLPYEPRRCRAKPKITENISTCRMSPLAKAPTMVFGITFRMKPNALILTSGYIGSNLGSIQGGWINVHARAWLDNVHDDQTNDQRQGRNDFEVQQRVTAGPANRFHALHTSDTADHGAEDDGGNDHFDQFDEPVTQWLQCHAGLRVEVT